MPPDAPPPLWRHATTLQPLTKIVLG